jgi:uncharacterized protein YndB with AHSA1/START domain
MTDPIVADTDVFITRMFAAPREVVFRFWTEPERLASWFGPKNWHTPVESVVFEPEIGGRFELRMVPDDGSGPGSQILGRVEEFLPPELLTVSTTVPASEYLPEINVRLRIQFHDHGDRTRMTLHQGPFTTAEQVDLTTSGWAESFVKLDELVTSDGKA